MTKNFGLQRFVPVAIVAGVVLIALLGVGTLRSASREGDRLKERLAVLETLRERHAALRETSATLSLRIRPGRQGSGPGITTAVEEVFSTLGLSDRIVGIKPGERSTLPSGELRETVRVEAGGLDLNAVVNLLHRVDTYPGALQVVDLHMKTDFERPELLNLELQLALVAKGA